MSGSGRKNRSAQPLLGAVICCTSVLAEKRSQYADYALQMGADHKLDLTSDVTHLLVGDTDTPKYKYVAREREDVKVLRPEWIEAVREAYMADDGVDLNALEAEYKLPTFAGLTICITGFDDLTLRAQLQQQIDAEGGKYTGDLTKHVTHLVAARPEGKKYQYAMQWAKKIVTVGWLYDSVERQMQLDETKYHPSLPFEQQGVGAWNKDAKHANQLGKRSRPQEPLAAEPSRKLRRTASAKLSSQNEVIWADINGVNGGDPPEREPLRPSDSVPAIRPDPATLLSDRNPVRPQSREQTSGGGPKQPLTAFLSHGYMDGSYFCVDNFDPKRTGVLKETLLNRGGTVLDSLSDMLSLEHVSSEQCFLIVPHETGATGATEIAKNSGKCQIVTELWVEICMERKQVVPPSTYPLGNLLSHSKEFQTLSVNSSGFPGIERNHVAKVVQATAAKYEEVLKPGLSVMICYSDSCNMEKVRHAREWGIPVVTASWLWESLQMGAPVAFTKYSLGRAHLQGKPETSRRLLGTRVGESFASEDRMTEATPNRVSKHLAGDIPTQCLPRKENAEKRASKERPGSDFLTEERVEDRADHRELKPSRANADTVTPPESDHNAEAEPQPAKDLPLRETAGNSPPKARSSSRKRRMPLFQTLDGASSIPDLDEDGPGSNTAAHTLATSNEGPQTTELLNGAIQDLLNQRGRPKASASTACQLNKRPLNRTLSNISNVSGSGPRASRTGSVSSVNTDGLGSEIAIESAAPRRAASSSRGRGSFTGRAKARDESQQTIWKPAATELYDPTLCREDFAEEEVAAQQLTQLGYEDPEEAVALRAKLAEKRRKKSKAGQEDPDPDQLKTKAQPRRIQDDDAIFDAKWAGGRRTRHKDRTPPGLQGLNDF